MPFLIDKADKPNFLRLTKHEAGHYIVAKALGFSVKTIFLEMRNPHGHHSGGSELDLWMPVAGQQQTEDYLAKRIAILLAGAVGEAWIDGEVKQDAFAACLQVNGAQDRLKTHELLQLLRNLRHPGTTVEAQTEKELADLETQCINIAVDEIRKHQAAFDELAQSLLARLTTYGIRETMTKGDVDALPAIKACFP
ncbi:hypothetical protein [Variovorax sp. PAMC26660]|uniref:hypothetical protein n=1 Tax=Variovorax sp. PAMC26660 TaxID=2762322 RepID=UPI00164DD956|nr:hypothetical protein [Variovorax sp. PAMC26660]QNK66082.1 hypothetical protein H7F35_23155 [Variovorax sp. PAMC26660]